MTALNERIASLSPEKRELLLRKLGTKGSSQEASRIPKVDRSRGDFPLSFAQQRYWFLDQLEPGNAAYNIHLPLSIADEVDRAALRRALDEVLRRHESLRTYFVMNHGEPVQRVAPAEPLELREIELEAFPESERELRAAERASALAVEPFDLSRAPLLRAALLRIGPKQHVLSLITHHIVCDRWSLGILLREILVLYHAFAKGEASPLPEPAIQYIDFTCWQREWLAGEVLEKQLEFWRGALQGPLPVLELPTDRPRPPIQTFRGSTRGRRLSRAVRDELERLGQSERATLFMTVLAGFQVLLYRYTGETDLLVGSPVASRTRPELEPLVGFFANTLVLRTSLEGNPTFRELLGRVRDTALDAFSHQDLPFEKLVEELRPERNLSQNPLFQVLLTFQNAAIPSKVRTEAKLGLLPVESRTAQFDLSLYVDDTSSGLVATMEYNTDLFEAATIERMLGHLEQVFHEVLRAPESLLSEIGVLTEAERRALTVETNPVPKSVPPPPFFHEAFRERARENPDSIALCFEEEQISYGELDRRSNRLAHWLRSRGVGPERVVGVSMEPGIDLVVSLLGVAKAGGAYLPLDPAFPSSRIALMLEDSGASLVLTTEAVVEDLPPEGPELVPLDSPDVRAALARAGDEEVTDEGLVDDSLAYMIYTSGSTGRPKGVQVPHRALTNFLASMRAEPGLERSDVLLSVTTFSFDIAALELFLPLVTGARLVLVPRDVTRDGRALLAAASAAGATVLQATPATWRLLLEASWNRDRAPLKALCGGEALPEDLARELSNRSTSAFNLYGPTETTIWSMVEELKSGAPRVSLGRPIQNTRVYVLDRDLEPVPFGVPGEIYIAGEGVTRGYWGRLELTAERYLPDPFSVRPGDRMYRTGDLARRREDGGLEYLGRNDFQVKVRGFRIELGEIEAALRAVPGVGAGVVLARRPASSDTQLVAYVVYEPESAPTVTEIRNALKEKLPLYMVPSSFVSLDALPLTPNGKVDRRALERAELADARGTVYVEPVTEMERLVASLWRDVLSIDRVSRQDNFFDLGGHSLLSMKVISRLEDEIGERVNPRELIFQTLEQFAAACEAQKRRRGENRSGLVAKLVDRLKGRLKGWTPRLP